MSPQLRLFSLSVSGLIVCLPLLASEPEYISSERPSPDTVLDLDNTMGKAREPKETLPEWERRLMKRATNLKNFFWDDASLLLKPRSYYMDKQRDDSADSEAWALGGALQYRTGLFRGRVRLGTTFYTTQKLYGPSDKEGTKLLKSGQQGFNVLGESYAEVNLTQTADLRLYRQSLSHPYVNKQDNRMVPNTFEAYTLFDDKSPHFNYVLGHITRMKKRTATTFSHMSEAAGADNSNKGLSMIGGRYSLTPLINIGAVNHYSWDVMNIFYTEANAAWKLNDHLALRLSGQYTNQQDIGDHLIGKFDTGMYGIKLAMSYKNATLTLARTAVDNNSKIQSPFGGYPGYASIIVKDFDRAGEDAWLAGLSYDFSRLGLEGLSAFTNYVHGDTPDSGSDATPDQKELDFTIDYQFGKQRFDGLWIRARAAFVDQSGSGAEDINDYRVIVNYSIPLHN